MSSRNASPSPARARASTDVVTIASSHRLVLHQVLVVTTPAGPESHRSVRVCPRCLNKRQASRGSGAASDETPDQIGGYRVFGSQNQKRNNHDHQERQQRPERARTAPSATCSPRCPGRGPTATRRPSPPGTRPTRRSSCLASTCPARTRSGRRWRLRSPGRLKNTRRVHRVQSIRFTDPGTAIVITDSITARPGAPEPQFTSMSGDLGARPPRRPVARRGLSQLPQARRRSVAASPNPVIPACTPEGARK